MDEKELQQEREFLEELFASARRDSNAPNPRFMHSLNADMERWVPRRSESGAPFEYHRPILTPLWRYVTASGLVGAAALGVWIGLLIPDTLNDAAEGYLASETFGIEAFLPYADLTALTE